MSAKALRQLFHSLLLTLFVTSLLEADDHTFRWTFDDTAAGAILYDWHREATGSDGVPLWRVEQIDDAPSPPHAIVMARPAQKTGWFGFGNFFNLLFTDVPQMKDGSISVAFKAIHGTIDQGGGPMWRVKDRNNYYVVRFNPLENNFRLYYVKSGHRHLIANADIRLKEGWHRIDVTQQGTTIRCRLDGRLLLQAQDDHIQGAGGVGLWSKADAVTAFDDFLVKVDR